MKKVLLVCFSFPPSGGIGGRRWAKFAKQLKARGCKVKIIAAAIPGKDSAWKKDAENLDIVRVPYNYPAILDKHPETLFEKIRYRATVVWMTGRIKGSIYDRAVFMKNAFIKKIREMIVEEDFDNLIVSGPPFRLTWYAAIVKKEFPSIRLIADFRDPWTWGDRLGYNRLPPSEFLAEKLLEREVMTESDVVLAPADFLTAHLKNEYPEFKDKLVHLPHGFDPSEIPASVQHVMPSLNEKLRLVYGGTWYSGLEVLMKPFAESLEQAGDGSVSVDFICESPPPGIFKNLIKTGKVQWLSPLPSDTFLAKLSEYHGFLLPVPLRFRDFFSSKFFEILSLRLPIVVYGFKGVVSDFIEQQKLGIVFETKHDETRLAEFFKHPDGLTTNLYFDVRPWSFPNLTNQLIQLLK